MEYSTKNVVVFLVVILFLSGIVYISFNGLVKFRIDNKFVVGTKIVYGEATATTLKFRVFSFTDKNVSPVNQTLTIPAFNITNNGTSTAETGLYIRLNESLPFGYVFVCNTTYSANGIPVGATLDTTKKLIYEIDITAGETIPLYCWMNLSSPINLNPKIKLLAEIV